MLRVLAIVILFGLAVWLVLWARWPADQFEWVARAAWVLLIGAAWWLAGRVPNRGGDGE